jgi:hypothetical protein
MQLIATINCSMAVNGHPHRPFRKQIEGISALDAEGVS